MPYAVKKVGDKYAVVKKSDPSKVFGTHPTAEQAQKQIIAIHFNEKK